MDADAVPTGDWRTRLRWRLRGALTWPLFLLLTVLEVLALQARPIAGKGIGVAAGFLLVGFINLLVVAVATPPIARWRRRGREPAEPLEIAKDRTAVALLLGVAVALLAAGIAHHPSVVRLEREDAAARGAVYRYVHAQAPAYRAGLLRADIEKPGDHLYRICVPGPDPRRALCLYVQTDQSPPGVALDPDQEPNSVLFGGDSRDG
jgi:hypothetical protein